MKDLTSKIIKLKNEHPELSTRQISNIAKCDNTTVWRTLKRYGIEPKKVNDYIKNRQMILAGLQDGIAKRLLDEESLSKASLKDKTIALGVLYDKERLESGKSTQNIALSKIVERIHQKNNGQED